MNTTSASASHWSAFRLLLRDYVNRRLRRLAGMAALYLMGALFWILAKDSTQPTGGMANMLLIFIVGWGNDFPRPTISPWPADRKTVRTLPVTDGVLDWATWVEYVGIPFVLCMVSAALMAFIGLFSLPSAGRAVEAASTYVVMVGLFQSAVALASATGNRHALRSAALGEKPWSSASGLTTMIIGISFFMGVWFWVWRESSYLRLIAIGAPVALLLFYGSFHFRRYLVRDPRTLKMAALSVPVVNSEPVFSRHRGKATGYALAPAIKSGMTTALIVAAAAIAMGLYFRGKHPSSDGAFFLILATAMAFGGGMSVVAPALASVRACRMLPVGTNLLTANLMAVQLFSVLPALLLLTATSLTSLAPASRVFPAQAILGMGLALEAVYLFLYAELFRLGMDAYKNAFVLLGMIVCTFGMLVRMLAPVLFSLWLPVLGPVLFAVSLVFCFLRLRAMLANDSRVYHQPTTVVFGVEM